jgi:hypothetical protein
MNLAELGALVTIVTGTAAGCIAAHEHAAGWATLLFAGGGLAVGAVFAFAATKLAYAALHRAIRPPGQRETTVSIAFGILYFLIPLLSMIAAGTTVEIMTVMLLDLNK